MVLSEEFSPFNFEMVSQVPHLAGIFELADDKRDVIFIGKAVDLKTELLGIFDSFDPCLEDAKFYRIEINPEVDSAYKKLFRKYKEDNRGMVPRCNGTDPTVMDEFHL